MSKSMPVEKALPRFWLSARKAMYFAPVPMSTFVVHEFGNLKGSANTVCSVSWPNESRISTCHRSAPNDSAGDGSKRTPSVACLDFSGLRRGLPPANWSYWRLPGWQMAPSDVAIASKPAEQVYLSEVTP